MAGKLSQLTADLDHYAIFQLDASGRVASWNSNAARLKGYSAEEAIGMHFSAFYPAARVASGYPDWALRQAARDGFYLDEGWRVRKDGSRFWAHVVITAQRSPDGGLHGFVKVVRDETEARARRQRLSKRFTDLFDLTPVGIGMFDEQGQVLDVNSALADLLGYQSDDLYHMTVGDLLHPRERAADLIQDVADARAPNHSVQRELVRADGRAVYCDVRGEVTIRDDGSRCWLLVFQDVSERHRQVAMLRYQATHDALTGLLNRTGLNDLLSPLLADPVTAARTAVLYCDIDNFKRVNDSLGHEAGDEILVALARRLLGGLPPDCTAARLYGDEFVVVSADVEAAGGLDTLTRRVSQLMCTTIPMRDEQVQVTASIGAAVPKEYGSTGDHLLRFADAAMFDAKDRGGAQVSLAHPTISSAADSMHLEGQLRAAIDGGELSVHYQPIVARDGTVVSAEALVRWPHPDRGPLMPATILPIAQAGGLLRALDSYMLRAALREAATWPAAGQGVSVAVNLSRLLPDDPEFAGTISAVIDETGIDPHRVILEFVEGTLIELSAECQKTLAELIAQGVRFGIDDFGTGHSSLARLKGIPAQIVKLDRQFIRDIEHDPADVAIAHATVTIARALNLFSIAEGVETVAQFQLLAGIAPDAYQGWLFSPALPADKFRALLEQGKVAVPSAADAARTRA